MGFPFRVPHVAPLDSPTGEWDRRCRVCSESCRLIPMSSASRSPGRLAGLRRHMALAEWNKPRHAWDRPGQMTRVADFSQPAFDNVCHKRRHKRLPVCPGTGLTLQQSARVARRDPSSIQNVCRDPSSIQRAPRWNNIFGDVCNAESQSGRLNWARGPVGNRPLASPNLASMRKATADSQLPPNSPVGYPVELIWAL